MPLKFVDQHTFNVVLDVPYPQHIGQTTGYRCGPATVQTALQIVGARPPTGEVWEESTLGNEMGTDTDGTDHVGLLAECLNGHAPQGQWEAVFVGNDPMTPEQKEQFWTDLTSSLSAGNPVPMNWVAPPGSGPVAVRGSGQPNYPAYSTCFHYVLANGAIEDETGRFVAVTDSGFQPPQYVVKWDGPGSACSLIPPKGYVKSNAAPTLPPPPTPDPTPPAPAPLPAGPVAPAAPVPTPPESEPTCLTGRPHHHSENEDTDGQVLDIRAEGLITQALVYSIAEKLGLDASGIYRAARDSL